jgi:threonine dehydrogenase-like Zn-dependent dehydrogenase
MSMRQLVYVSPRQLEWHEAQAPSLQSDQTALVRPIAVATCDLDALIIAGSSPFAAPDGTCTSTAIYFGEQPSLPLLEMYTKGITFATGRAHVRAAMPQVLALAQAGAFHPEHVTTKTVDWNDAADALTSGHWTKLVFRRD